MIFKELPHYQNKNTFFVRQSLTPYSLDQNSASFLCDNEQSEDTKKRLSFGSM